GHTRWATHGGVTDANAHPHVDCSGRFAVIHNGIIENFQSIRDRLETAGHQFTSDTDSEALAHLVEDAAGERTDPTALTAALRGVFGQIRGLNAIIVMDTVTGTMAAVKNISPLVVGIGVEGSFIASDAVALIGHADRVHYLEDGQIVTIGPEGMSFLAAASGLP